MDFLKDFGLENLEALTKGALEEFPDRGASRSAAADTTKAPITAAVVNKARQAYAAWNDWALEAQRDKWHASMKVITRAAARDAKGARADWEQRAQTAESQLVQLLQQLTELPDPVPILESATTLSQRVVEVEALNHELQAAAALAAADHREVSDLVAKHRALEAAHKALQESAARQEVQLKEATRTLADMGSARDDAAKASAEVARLQGMLRTLRAEHDAAQAALFDAASQKEAVEGNRQRELDALQEELDAVSQRCAELEGEKARLAQQLGVAKAPLPVADQILTAQDGALSSEDAAAPLGRGDDSFWERQLRARAEELEALQVALDRAAREAGEAEARHDTAARAAANQLSAAQLIIAQLQAELKERPTLERYKELQSRAAALQQLVDVQVETEGWDVGVVQHHTAALGGPGSVAATHELLQERNRALASSLAAAKRAEGDKSGALADVAADLAASRKEATALQALVKRLETDLAAMRAAGVSAALPPGPRLEHAPRSGSATGAAAASRPDTAGGGELAGDVNESGPPEPGTPPAGVEGVGSSGSNVLEILALQRDRFRQRATQLEEEKGALEEELAAAKRSLEKARADNVVLFEKVRYLEQYAQKVVAAAAGGAGPGGRTTILRVDGDGLVISPQADAKSSRYQCGPLSLDLGGGGRAAAGRSGPGGAAGGARPRGAGSRNRVGSGLCFPADVPDEEVGLTPEARAAKAYESRLNPFTEFQASELESRVKALQLHERAVLAGGRLLIGTQLGRAFVAVYALLLHLFVMVLLWYAMSPQTHVEYVLDTAQLVEQAASDSSA